MIRVYRIPFSTNVERVALAAGHKGVGVEWVDVDPADRSPVREVSGQRLVPVLVADGEVVADSRVILRWLEQRYPEPPLYPQDEARRAEADLFVEWFDAVWKGPPNAIADGLARGDLDERERAELGGRMRSWLGLFERLLAGRDYLLGDFGVADCIAFPFLKYAALGLPEEDDEPFHRVLVEELPLAGGYPRLTAWVRRVDVRPRA